MIAITERQREVLDFIKNYISSHKYPPTIREISEYFGISVKGAYDHVKALERKEYIHSNNNRSRTIEVVGEEEDDVPRVVMVPVLGNVAAGQPLFAEENHDGAVAVPQEYVKSGCRHFALNVKGDSMQDAGIIDGDIAVFAQQPTARNGDIVVAMVEDAYTLKRFYKEKNRVRLQAENPAYPPIYTQNVRILGRLVHLVRTYD